MRPLAAAGQIDLNRRSLHSERDRKGNKLRLRVGRLKYDIRVVRSRAQPRYGRNQNAARSQPGDWPEVNTDALHTWLPIVVCMRKTAELPALFRFSVPFRLGFAGVTVGLSSKFLGFQGEILLTACAPIGKVGFYTVTDAENDAFQAAENANRNTSTFFPFYSYGVRLGHRHEANLDISVGKWANYEYIEPYNFTTALQPSCTMPATNPSTAACDIRQQLWRYGFEGLLVIPNTPLVIGLSANVAAQHPRGPNLFYLSPLDDLRFLFGVRFAASKLTGALSKLGGQ